MREGLVEEEIWFPSFVHPAHEVTDERDVIRSHGPAQQRHVRLLRSSIAFAVVAAHAGTDHVFPGVFAAPRNGDDVVDRQRQVSPSAILAPMPIAPQDILAREDDPLVGNLHVHRKLDDAWKRHRRGNGSDDPPLVRLNQFCFAKVKQNNSLLHIYHTHRLVVLIQNQNLGIHLTVSRSVDVVRAELNLPP